MQSDFNHVPEEPTAKDKHILELKKRVQESKLSAEKLLGFSLNQGHFMNGEAYRLMPACFVHPLHFQEDILPLQQKIVNMKAIINECKAELAVLKSPNFKSSGCVTHMQQQQQIEQFERNIHMGEHQLQEVRSWLLGYMMAHQPILDTNFNDKLATHLDVMLDSYLELWKLQHSELKL